MMTFLPMSFLMVSAFLASSVNADHPASPVNATAVKIILACPTNKTTDAAIVKAIQEKIKTDGRWTEEDWSHINVMSKNRQVKLEGWVVGKAQKDAITKFAETTECVIKKKIKNLLKTERQGSCSPGQKPCCGGCIEKSSVCSCINKG
jgi:hypothetical protein